MNGIIFQDFHTISKKISLVLGYGPVVGVDRKVLEVCQRISPSYSEHYLLHLPIYMKDV